MTIGEKIVLAGIAFFGVFIVGSLLFMIVTAFTGFHLSTGEGDHTGYITSVETTGLVFKTDTAYLKTSTQSTQEDAYCVTDPSVSKQLQEASVSRAQVNVHFHSWIVASIRECKHEDAIIDSVTVLTQ